MLIEFANLSKMCMCKRNMQEQVLRTSLLKIVRQDNLVSLYSILLNFKHSMVHFLGFNPIIQNGNDLQNEFEYFLEIFSLGVFYC